MKKQAKSQKVLLAIEVELGRNGKSVTREVLLKKYMENPYMERFLAGQVKGKSLAEIVEDIDCGKSHEKVDKAIQQGVKLREAKFKHKLQGK